MKEEMKFTDTETILELKKKKTKKKTADSNHSIKQEGYAHKTEKNTVL